jgi:uncharacterized metal-binding protein
VPCNGIGRLVSTVVREAARRVQEMRPDQVVVLASCALAVQDECQLTDFGRYPVVVIDGCRPHCSSVLASELGKEPAARVYVPDVMAKHKIAIAGEKRRGLTKRGYQLVEAVAAEAVEQIDRIIADEMLAVL